MLFPDWLEFCYTSSIEYDTMLHENDLIISSIFQSMTHEVRYSANLRIPGFLEISIALLRSTYLLFIIFIHLFYICYRIRLT